MATATTGSKARPLRQSSRTDDDGAEQLPQPPEVPRRLRLSWPQAVGLVMILLLPALSAARLFDPRPQTSTASVGAVALAVTSPGRMRHRTSDWVEVDVRNRSARALADVQVELGADFVQGFSQAVFIPAATTVDARAYRVAIGALGPGESQRVALQLQADRYGSRRGMISARAGASRAEVPISIFVFP